MLPENKRINSKKDLLMFLEIEYNKYGLSYPQKVPLFFKENELLAFYHYLLRHSEYHVNRKNRIRSVIYRAALYTLSNLLSIHIPINCCDMGLKIMHVGPVLMNGNVTVGKNCAFHINTGLAADGLSDEAPTLGDGVVVGFGACILGGVTIADNVAIGANAVVTKDITECDVAVAGVPAKIISNNGRTKWNKQKKHADKN